MLKFDFDSNYHWLHNNTVFVTRTGSHAYGTNIATSDEDFKGIALGKPQHYLGIQDHFEQYSLKSPDLTIFEFKKAIGLLMQGNPNTIEMLFTSPEDHVFVNKIGQQLIDIRESFISKSLKERFLGYAKAQAHRIKTHRRWILNPIIKKPLRSDFDLPDHHTIPTQQYEAVKAQIKSVLDGWNVSFEPFSESQKIWLQRELADILADMSIYQNNTWMLAARKLDYSDNFIYLLNKEKEFEAAMKEWHNYQEWKTNRNEVRAALEEKCHYDAKHASHLYRLCLMAKEILETGKVIVKRPDAEEILEIRLGNITYEDLMARVDKLEQDVKIAYDKCTLQKQPDKKLIEDFCIRILKEHLNA